MLFMVLIVSLMLTLVVRRLKKDRIEIIELKNKVESYEKEKAKKVQASRS